MDISILTKRYSTPVAIKAIGSIVFIVAFIMMVAIPVFALIPQDQYINVFNMQGVANGTYDSTTYTIFTMLARLSFGRSSSRYSERVRPVSTRLSLQSSSPA